MSGLAAARAADLADAGRPALIVVDVQRDFADPEVLSGWGVEQASLDAVGAAVDRCSALVASARAAGVPVIWVELAADPATPWRASAWLRTGRRDGVDDELCAPGTPGARWWMLDPAEHELRVPKRHYSGFDGTGLADALRGMGVGWVGVAGLTTECCVLATATDAAQADFPVVVATDATATYTQALHDAALEIMALNVADLRTADELATLWGAGVVADGGAA
jgi:ureidoacrylate peracid hydrolase